MKEKISKQRFSVRSVIHEHNSVCVSYPTFEIGFLDLNSSHVENV